MHEADVNMPGGGLKHTGLPNGHPARTPGAQSKAHPGLQLAVPEVQLMVH